MAKEPFVLESDSVHFFDCDETLVLWEFPESEAHKAVSVSSGHHMAWVLPHADHIAIIRQSKARGQKIVVWSAGGWEWAEAVVKALGITDCVDAVMRKPTWYWDDLPAQEILGVRAYKKLEWQK